MVKGAPVHQHGLKMIRLIEQLESLNSPLDRNLATDIFVASFSDSFSQFVMNYNMGKMEHTRLVLLNMCVTTEKTFKRGGNGTIAVFEKGSTSSAKPGNKGKGKFNANKKKKEWNPKLKPKGGVKKK
ncbi:uncharacterized protein LOC110771843 [Prunus avium]|uniref:Uncharacterized protein LOC110771843 n=1 Tax=Prunus avium TaxID=42229 RepID=A0A6P5TVR8_PRUAV|nr:uncharacterized protein LOC110771843 [Prunus avium]